MNNKKYWTIKEDVAIAKFYKANAEYFRAKKPNWTIVDELMESEEIKHPRELVVVRLRNFIYWDDKARTQGAFNPTTQILEIFNEYVKED